METKRPPKMRYCTRCVYPSSSAVPLAFDENGVCSGCRAYDQRKNIDWDRRIELLKKIVEKYKSKDGSNYDCIIPVSGGKDSYFQTYYVTKVLGLKPLLVTYHGNNYLEVGERNLKKMREVFNVDSLVFGPSVEILKKLNKKCFKLMGDMNWHNHCGIFTYPVQIAVKMKIPLIIWGEHGYTDLGGMYSMNDMVEMTKKYRTEHACRGYDWNDMVDEEIGIREQDVLWAKYPADEEIEEVDVRGIYLGLFVPWDANAHVKKMIDEFGWEESPEPFERTYRRFSNLDDMHENGMHDYLKYIKFGYGRATDHSCKDIRAGYITREKGIEMVRKYDHVKSSDLKRWLKYVDMTEGEFDGVADTFRDPNVWWKNEKGEWIKDNLWDEHLKEGESIK
ncbi:N-acetyl sugar amidotransferase [Candidatus Pacearchaeota archaeon CG10_big_fil_rev_8_21_14_0_10_32_42]|nr:MAG: N-acetyl sugar amidotransferase [Candidatus Pacearchaeota archaeon CG10_big_fil_rev_8_21_14_0_10_32_42]